MNRIFQTVLAFLFISSSAFADNICGFIRHEVNDTVGGAVVGGIIGSGRNGHNTGGSIIGGIIGGLIGNKIGKKRDKIDCEYVRYAREEALQNPQFGYEHPWIQGDYAGNIIVVRQGYYHHHNDVRCYEYNNVYRGPYGDGMRTQYACYRHSKWKYYDNNSSIVFEVR